MMNDLVFPDVENEQEDDEQFVQNVRLGVNVDHVATLRQQRGTNYPDPVRAALVAEEAGAHQITVHLREDRRHIQERDVHLLKELLNIDLNLEMAITPEMVTFAKKIKPTYCCLVPEKREELTTEGGLDVVNNFDAIKETVAELEQAGIEVSLFIDPDSKQIETAFETGARIIELHTGRYAEAENRKDQSKAFEEIFIATMFADSLGFDVNAGHGLHYHNTYHIAQIPQIKELNIGHAIVAQAVFTGMEDAVKSMLAILDEAREC